MYGNSELILNSRNNVYHLDLNGGEIADDVILVGDPGRVSQISARFSRTEFRRSHREFITHTGDLHGRRVTVLSTGIGPDNIDIVMNELDAAVNIDPITRERTSLPRTLRITRLGTCGALQENVRINDLVASEYAIGTDNLAWFYSSWPSHDLAGIAAAFIKHMSWHQALGQPYCAKSSAPVPDLEALHKGITITAPGFYAPQGRELRLACSVRSMNELLGSFSYSEKKILNFEMETSAIFALGTMLGHSCRTICVAIANRRTGEFSTDISESVNSLLDRYTEQIIHI